MCADGGPWGWWPLFATFNPALIYVLCNPHLNPKGLHLGQYVFLWRWSSSWRGRHRGLTCRIWGFRSCGHLMGWLGDGGTGGKTRLLYGRLGWSGVGVWCDSLQESIETFCLWSYHHFSHLPPPLCLQLMCSLLQLSSSLHSKLACCNDHKPWKERKKGVKMECQTERERFSIN